MSTQVNYYSPTPQHPGSGLDMLCDISFIIGEMCHLIKHNKSSKEWEKDQDLIAILNVLPRPTHDIVDGSGNQDTTTSNELAPHNPALTPSVSDHEHLGMINIPPHHGKNFDNTVSIEADDGAAFCQMQMPVTDDAPDGQRRNTPSGLICNARLNTYEEVRYHFSNVHSTSHKTYDEESGRCSWKGCNAVVTNV